MFQNAETVSSCEGKEEFLLNFFPVSLMILPESVEQGQQAGLREAAHERVVHVGFLSAVGNEVGAEHEQVLVHAPSCGNK